MFQRIALRAQCDVGGVSEAEGDELTVETAALMVQDAAVGLAGRAAGQGRAGRGSGTRRGGLQ
jgi:hypothetical protein